MGAVFNKTELMVLLQDFHQLTGLRAVVFDAYGMDVLSYPPELPEYCRLIRQSPKGETGCHLCDQNACRTATQRKETVIYPCHAGLIEVITPILINDAAVGFLLLSHIVQGADEAAEWQRARSCCALYGVDETALKRAYMALPRTTYQTLKSAADLLALAAAALYQKGLARLTPGSAQARLIQYVSEHLADDLSSDALCRELSISRTGLYHLSCQTYGCGISEQITRMRIHKAMELLAETKLTNAEICRKIGIQDYNYFYRVFRRQAGLTPRQYRAAANRTDGQALPPQTEQP